MTTRKFDKRKVSDAEIRRLVVERLKKLPSGKQVSIGSDGSFTQDELIERVQSGDAIGEKIIEIELEFLQALKSGEFFGEPTSTSN